MPHRFASTLLVLAMLAMFLPGEAFATAAADQAAPGTSVPDKAELQKMAQESSNPVGRLWTLTNQFCYDLQSPNLKPQFNWNFQPVLTFDIGDLRLITRPVVPVYDSPVTTDTAAKPGSAGKPGSPATEVCSYASGLGDAEFLAKLSPINNGPGFFWGAGPSAVFPTATDKALGSGKWQLGAAGAAGYKDDKWIVGVFPQQRWSIAGDPARNAVSTTKAMYFIWYSPVPTWQVGMGPTAIIDWEQKKIEDAVTLPVGLGVAKMVMLGKLPLKIGLEADYSVIRPQNASATVWAFRLSLTPIIPHLF